MATTIPLIDLTSVLPEGESGPPHAPGGKEATTKRAPTGSGGPVQPLRRAPKSGPAGARA